MHLEGGSTAWLKLGYAKTICQSPLLFKKRRDILLPSQQYKSLFLSGCLLFIKDQLNHLLELGSKGHCWKLLAVRHLMRTVAMKIKDKQRLTVRNTVSESSRQQSKFLDLKFLKHGWGWHWPSDKFLVSSLNVSGNGIRHPGELSEWAIEQETGRLPIHDLLFCYGKILFVSFEFMSICPAELQKKSSLNSQWFQVRREKNWKC